MINLDLSMLSVPVVQYQNFADDDLLSLITRTTREMEHHTQETTVSTGEQGFRSSVVSYERQWPELYQRFSAHLEAILPHVKQELGDYCYKCDHTYPIEMQMTTHYRTGDHFHSHVDNGSRKTAARRLSYVYYYQLTPERMFTGGELRLHLKLGVRTVEPIHNSIVLFPSHLYHEVMPIQSVSGKYEDGRHTINGWISTNAEDAL